jgi:hypothetical protein
MNKKFFKRYKATCNGGYWETISVISDGKITPDPTWEETEVILNPVVTLYQCHNPETCVKEYMRKQEIANTLKEQLAAIKAKPVIRGAETVWTELNFQMSEGHIFQSPPNPFWRKTLR